MLNLATCLHRRAYVDPPIYARTSGNRLPPRHNRRFGGRGGERVEPGPLLDGREAPKTREVWARVYGHAEDSGLCFSEDATRDNQEKRHDTG